MKPDLSTGKLNETILFGCPVMGSLIKTCRLPERLKTIRGFNFNRGNYG